MRPEEQPRRVDDDKRQQRLRASPQPAARLVKPARQKALRDLQSAIRRTPCDVIHGRTMPKAADRKRHHDVQRAPKRADAAAAQRNIDVIPEPCGQADVPPPPEIPNGDGEIRLAEILHQVVAQYLRRADGDVAVPAEIAVNLKGKGDRRQQDLQPGGLLPVAVYRIDIQARPVGDDQLFKKAQQHHQQTVPNGLFIQRMILVDLTKQVFRALNRSSDQLRKKGDEQRIAHQAALRRELAAIDVDHIPQRLKRVKADAHRQQHVKRRNRQPHPQTRGNSRECIGKKSKIFEKTQNAQIDRKAERQNRAPPRFGLHPPQRQRAEIRHKRARGNQQRILRIPAHVEIVAGREQPRPARPHGQQIIGQRDDREEREKRIRIKYHTSASLTP